MDVDVDIIEKELKYLSMKFSKCKNLDRLIELNNKLNVLNMFYKLHTGKDYESACNQYFDEDEFTQREEYVYAYKQSLFIKHFVRDLELLDILLQKVNDNNVEYDIKDIESIELSYDEMKEIILDFYSIYGTEIYSIVNKVFNNKQVQIIIEDENNKLVYTDALSYFIGEIDRMDLSFYKDSSVEKLMNIVNECKEYLNKDNIDTNCASDYISKLMQSYNEMESLDKKHVKEELIYEYEDDAYGMTFDFKEFNKSYVVIYHDNAFDTMIALVHELAHCIEDEYLIYNSNIKNVDSRYFVEFIPALFEFEFLSYLRNKNMFVEESKCFELVIYEDIISRLKSIYDSVDRKLGEEEFESLVENIKYGLSYYMAKKIYDKYCNSKDLMVKNCVKIIKNRNSMCLFDLLKITNVSLEEFYDVDTMNENYAMILK